MGIAIRERKSGDRNGGDRRGYVRFFLSPNPHKPAMSFDRVPAGRYTERLQRRDRNPHAGRPDQVRGRQETGAVFVDRFMSTSMHYPCNYGYIRARCPATAIPAMCWCCRPCRSSRASWFAAGRSACSSWTTRRAGTRRFSPSHRQALLPVPQRAVARDLPEITTRQIAHFFEHYKDLEPGKWSGGSWVDAAEAKRKSSTAWRAMPPRSPRRSPQRGADRRARRSVFRVAGCRRDHDVAHALDRPSSTSS